MPLQAEQRIVPAHADAVVSDAHQTASASLDFHGDACGLRVNRVFHQLLHHAGRALNHFSSGDLVGNLFGQKAYPVHERNDSPPAQRTSERSCGLNREPAVWEREEQIQGPDSPTTLTLTQQRLLRIRKGDRGLVSFGSSQTETLCLGWERQSEDKNSATAGFIAREDTAPVIFNDPPANRQAEPGSLSFPVGGKWLKHARGDFGRNPFPGIFDLSGDVLRGRLEPEL